MTQFTLDNLPIDKDRFKLIALDLDDTLLKDDKTISDYTIKTLQKAQSQGYSIVIATGRHPKSAVRYMEMLGCLNEHSYAISFNGAAVVRLNDYISFGREIGFPTVCSETMSGSWARELAAFAHEHKLKVHAYSQSRGLLIEDLNPYTQREIDYCQVEYKAVDFLECTDDERLFKLLIVGDSDKIDHLISIVPKRFKDYFSVLRSSPVFLEFIPNHTHKGTGLESLCKTLGFTKHNAMAFGDAGNDLDMLKSAGLGVAMANGFDFVKEEADVVTKSNEEDGVAFLVDKFLKD